MTKSQIRELAQTIWTDSHLDKLILETERYMDQKEKEYVEAKRRTLFETLVAEGRQATDKEKYDACINRPLAKYRIKLCESEHKIGTGLTVMYIYGSEISYSRRNSHLMRHIILAHECGHILMHARRTDCDESLMLPPMSADMENDATYFAEEILIKLASGDAVAEYVIRNMTDNEVPDYNRDAIAD
jgi:hypothetical protein